MTAALPDGHVLAEWVGDSVVKFGPTGQLVGPGDVVPVPEGEASQSDNWKPLTAKQAAKRGAERDQEDNG